MNYTVRLDYAERTIGEVVGVYNDQLTNFVYETLNGSSDAIDLSRAHRALLRQLGPQSYLEGMREGGVPPEEADESDRATISKWVQDQIGFEKSFAADVVAARGDDGKRAAILARVGLWVAAMSALGAQGIASAKGNQMGRFNLGPTKEHCRTCAGLHGKRHRLSWFQSRNLLPRQMGNENFVCKGYRCECNIKFDDGTWLY